MTDIPIAIIPKNSREEIHISLCEYNGHQLFNARVFYKAADGEMRPSKAGIAFKVTALPEFTSAAVLALKEAQRRGLVE